MFIEHLSDTALDGGDAEVNQTGLAVLELTFCVDTRSLSSGCQCCAEKQAGYEELGPGREGGRLSHYGEVQERPL